MNGTIPRPGSVEARSRGCKCPMMDNRYGEGAYTDDNGVAHFWTVWGCPLHATTDEPTQKDPETGDLFA